MPRVRTFEDTFISSLRKLGYRVERSEKGTAFIFKEGWWGWVEFKKSKNSPKRPGQQQNIDWAQENSWGKFVYPENFEETKEELEALL